ncbi:MAG: matrixin family metalloprotease, partial [Proteobacteria bacterium]|nr:matrixin family metalloprotease [Pseudomonadota bacterium]
MLKQNGTLARIASLSFLMLGMGIQSVHGFTIISYDGKAARWNTDRAIQIEYDPDFGNVFDESGCDNSGTCVAPGQAIRSSVAAWRNVEGLDLKINTPVAVNINRTPKYDPQPGSNGVGKNQIKFYPTGWQNLPFVPPTSALAVTISTYNEQGQILDADIFINGEYFTWGVVNHANETNIHDLQNVLTHEIGHFLGLDHTSENMGEADMNRFNATMFFASLPGETFRRDLDKLDVYGIQHLYTEDNLPEPSVSEITPNLLQINYKGNATVEIYGDDFMAMTSVVLARKGTDGDIVGRVISAENSKITVAFDVSNLQSGEYDVVVANSYKNFTRIEKGMSVQNSTIIGNYNAEEGSSGGCHSNGSSSYLLF